MNLLKAINAAGENDLASMPGMTPDVVKRVMEHRKTGKPFATMMEFRKVTHITEVNLEKALEPFRENEMLMQMEARRRPVTPPPSGGKADSKRTARTAAADANGPPAASAPAPGPIGDVRPGYYGKLPGYESLDTIDPLKRKEFLERVNHEMCSCGCQGETLAYCLVNDTSCPLVKARVRKVYDEIVGTTPK